MGTDSSHADTVRLAFDSPPQVWRTLARALVRRGLPQGARPTTPRFEALWRGAQANPAALRSYLELCEDNNASAGVCIPPAPAPYYTFALPPLFIHAMAMPLHLAILTHPRFPLPLLGLVHLANRTEVLDTVAPGQRLDFTCSLTGIDTSPKGPKFTLVTLAHAGERLVWRERSTYLLPHRAATATRTARRPAPSIKGEEIARWEVAANIGRRFAVPVRDFNPIHLSNLSARLLGQRRAIAHGLYSAARCLDALRQHRPLSTPYVLDVAFQCALALPSQVVLYSQPVGAEHRFALHVLPAVGSASPLPHLHGSLKPLRRKR